MGTCTVTLDTKAFDSEVATRAQQRGQRVIRGTIAGSTSYTTDGDACDLTNNFPASNSTKSVKYRVILNPISNTGNRLGVYDHTNKKLLIYTGLGVQASGNQSVYGIFSFIAIGE